MLRLVKNLTGEFMRKISAASGNLFTDSWSWQSFVSSWDVFNCLFLLDVQNEIHLLSRFFCNSWLVCLLRFWLRNAPLVKVSGNPISDASFSKMSLFTCPCLRHKRVEKYQAILSRLDGPQEQHLDSAVDWYAWAIIVFHVFFRFLDSFIKK